MRAPPGLGWLGLGHQAVVPAAPADSRPSAGHRLHWEPVPVRRGRVCEHALQERRQVSGWAQHLQLRVLGG